MSTIRVRLFAAAKETAGRPTIEFSAESATSIADIRSRLSNELPALAGLIAISRFAVNDRYVSDAYSVSANDEIALIPPVSGG
jgi:molybdopterin converting factor subunit 1